jgi:hypothetical protein
MFKLFISLLILLTVPCKAQVIAKAGDGWDLKVDSAIQLLRTVDSSKYAVLKKVCHRVDFWKSSFSSNGILEGQYTILIADADIKLNSINNLAAVIVHESLHLLFMIENRFLTEKEEEYKCYVYELSFIQKLPTPEPWLTANAYDKVQLYKP